MDKNSGIYKITNTITGADYIGSSSNLRRRLKDHRNNLAANCHINVHLQRSWNKHGELAFEFTVLEFCEVDQLLIREQFYIDNEKPSYNICQIAGSSLGVKRSEETKQRLSESHKGERSCRFGKFGVNNPCYGKTRTEETKKRMSEAHKGHAHTYETKHKLSDLRKGKPNHNFGKHLSDQTKRKISEANKGTQMGEQNHNFGKHLSDETKQKLSESHKSERSCMFGKHLSEETKRKMSEAWKTRAPMSEETKQKLSEIAIRQWAKRKAEAQMQPRLDVILNSNVVSQE